MTKNVTNNIASNKIDNTNEDLIKELKETKETNEEILNVLKNMLSNKGKNYKDITVGEWVNEWYTNYALNTTDKKYVKGKLSNNEYFVSNYRIKYIINDDNISKLKLDEISSSDIYKFISNIKSVRKKLIKDNIKNHKTTTNTYLDINNQCYSYEVVKEYFDSFTTSFNNMVSLDKDMYDKRIDTIKYYYDHKYDNEEMSFKSKKNIVDLLRMAFRCAVKMEIIKETPFDSFTYDETKEIVDKKRDALTSEERDIFLKVAESNKYFDCYLLMVYTGMRKAEMLALTKKDIKINEDSNDKYIEVNKQLQFNKNNRYQNNDITSLTKSMHSVRKIPIANNEVLDMLNRRIKDKDDDEFIFSKIDKYMWRTHNQIYKDVKRLYNICFLLTGNEKFLSCHNHTLRHTFATLFLENYPNYLVQVSAILGHSNTSFTAKQYVHLETEKIDISLLSDRNK